MPGGKKLRRPERRKKVANARFQITAASFTSLITNYDKKLIDHHTAVIDKALNSDKINWARTNESIRYITRLRDSVRQFLRNYAKTIRSTNITGFTHIEMFAGRLKQLQEKQALFESRLKSIIKMRDKEFGSNRFFE